MHSGRKGHKLEGAFVVEQCPLAVPPYVPCVAACTAAAKGGLAALSGGWQPGSHRSDRALCPTLPALYHHPHRLPDQTPWNPVIGTTALCRALCKLCEFRCWLLAGHVAALRKLESSPDLGCVAYNLGTGTGTTVLEMVHVSLLGRLGAARSCGQCSVGVAWCAACSMLCRGLDGVTVRSCLLPAAMLRAAMVYVSAIACLPDHTVLALVAQGFEAASGLPVKTNLTHRRPGDAEAVWAATETAEKELG